jgi:hypothetical protein
MKKVAIHSVPRSGSSWLGQIFNSSPEVVFKYQPLFSYAFKGYLNEHSLSAEIDKFFSLLAASDDDFLDQKKKVSEGSYPAFAKDKNPGIIAYKEVRYHFILENLLRTDPEIKVIGLVRDPRATINSWLLAPREFRADLGWAAHEEWMYAEKKNEGRPEEYNGYMKWKEVTLLFEKLEKAFPSRFYLLQYKDLLADTEKSVKEIFSFCGISMSEQTRQFLDSSTRNAGQKNDAYSVFRSKEMRDIEWEKQLDPQIAEMIVSDVNSSGLQKYLGEGGK